MILSATSDERLDALCMQGVGCCLAAVPAIREEDIRMTARPASLVRDAGEVGDCRQDPSVIAGLHGRGLDDERDAVPVHDERALRAKFPPVKGPVPVASPSQKAWIMTLSPLADLSSRPPSQRCDKSMWTSFPTRGIVNVCMSALGASPAFEWRVFPKVASQKQMPMDLGRCAVGGPKPAAW